MRYFLQTTFLDFFHERGPPRFQSFFIRLLFKRVLIIDNISLHMFHLRSTRSMELKASPSHELRLLLIKQVLIILVIDGSQIRVVLRKVVWLVDSLVIFIPFSQEWPGFLSVQVLERRFVHLGLLRGGHLLIILIQPNCVEFRPSEANDAKTILFEIRLLLHFRRMLMH